MDCDPIFITDGRLWTSAGVTAGMDLALALVEEDLGTAVAHTVAQHLVLYLRRPGSQSQFSVPLWWAQRPATRSARSWRPCRPARETGTRSVTWPAGPG